MKFDSADEMLWHGHYAHGYPEPNQSKKYSDLLQSHASLCGKIEELKGQLDAANLQVRDALFALGRFEVQGCPCGARPETPNTHPHVIGCHIAEAISVLEGRSEKPKSEPPRCDSYWDGNQCEGPTGHDGKHCWMGWSWVVSPPPIHEDTEKRIEPSRKCTDFGHLGNTISAKDANGEWTLTKCSTCGTIL
jgi:hypothetical protein